jgi:glycosyltransferase involved in cell wall biosynthesis
MLKKILVVTDNLPTSINGVVTTYRNIEKYANIDGYKIHYVDPSMFKYIDAPGYPEVKLSFPCGIGKKIEDINPDYIHIATEGPLGFAARVYCDRRGMKYNTSYHTKFPEFLKEIYGIPECITYWALRLFHKHSGRVLTTTKTMVNDLVAHGFRTNIRDWTRGVDRDILKPTIEHKSAYIGLKPIVLYVGRVSKEKNLDALCGLQDHFNIEIVGGGPYLEHLRKTYPKVKFLGYQKGSELADSYTRADVFCFPSKTDTFGIVIIEALSVGTPVAAFPVPGPIDILEQGLTGHMSDDLFRSIQICTRLDRDRVKAASEKWTWERCWEIFKENLMPV